MKRTIFALGLAAALAGCSTTEGGNLFAGHSKTVEYRRVFDIRTSAPGDAMVSAANSGLERNVKNASVYTPTPAAGEPLATPGKLTLPQPADAAAGAAAAGAAAARREPVCDGASWTAKATPSVSGGEHMNLVACLFPYKGGYHLDMYTVFTRADGGWMHYPRQWSGMLLGTPEKWTEKAMLDVVRAIQASTSAQVVLVEAQPQMVGTPWLDAPAGGL